MRIFEYKLQEINTISTFWLYKSLNFLNKHELILQYKKYSFQFIVSLYKVCVILVCKFKDRLEFGKHFRNKVNIFCQGLF